jgi:hypothetical protein
MLNNQMAELADRHRNRSRQSLSINPWSKAQRSISRTSALTCRPTLASALASARASFVNRPCVVLAATMRAMPSLVLGPVLLPPWFGHRPVRATAGRWHGSPPLVLAPQRLPCQSAPKRVSLPMVLPFVNCMLAPKQ